MASTTLLCVLYTKRGGVGGRAYKEPYATLAQKYLTLIVTAHGIHLYTFALLTSQLTQGNHLNLQTQFLFWFIYKARNILGILHRESSSEQVGFESCFEERESVRVVCASWNRVPDKPDLETGRDTGQRIWCLSWGQKGSAFSWWRVGRFIGEGVNPKPACL